MLVVGPLVSLLVGIIELGDGMGSNVGVGGSVGSQIARVESFAALNLATLLINSLIRLALSVF